jgi:hypothetical protein
MEGLDLDMVHSLLAGSGPIVTLRRAAQKPLAPPSVAARKPVGLCARRDTREVEPYDELVRAEPAEIRIDQPHPDAALGSLGGTWMKQPLPGRRASNCTANGLARARSEAPWLVANVAQRQAAKARPGRGDPRHCHEPAEVRSGV